MAEQDKFLNADYISFEPNSDEKTLKLKDNEILGLVAKINTKYRESKDARRPHEDRMIRAYDNFRGVYGKTIVFRETEKSRVFVKITKTKVLAAYGQIIEVLFGGSAFPIGIRETEVPEGTVTHKHIPSAEVRPLAKAMEQAQEEDGIDIYDVGFKGDDKELPAGATYGILGKIKKALTPRAAAIEELAVKGPTNVPNEPQISPAKEAARRMERIIQDQLEESNAVGELSKTVFEGVMLGTGIIKGPFNYSKTLHSWKSDEEGKRTYTPKKVRSPRIEFVSVWDFYPDPNATCMDECDYIIHRHRMNRSQLRALSKQPLFKSDQIEGAVRDGPNYIKESYESILKALEEGSGRDQADRFEVLEYWGVIDAQDLKEVGVDLPDSYSELDEIQVNAWICGTRLLRAVVNPFIPQRIPYNAFCYEKNPYSFFGIGVPENMEDSQEVVNANARLAIDNLAISSNVIFDVDETALVDGQEFKIYPGKVFRRQAGSPGQAIYGINIPNVTQPIIMMMDKFRQLADESTGIPSYSHGQTGVQSMTRTASGMSMLLGAASLNIKTVIKSIDELLKNLGDAHYNWNMQFNESKDLADIDLEVRALGTTSIMQKEVRSQRLTTLLQIIVNPTLAPMVKIPTLLKELAHSLDLDPEELINNPDEARIMAEIIGLVNAQRGSQPTSGPSEQQNAMGGPPGIPGGGANQGTTGTGNGTIGTGSVPMAGEPEFSG
jgi:hypothetical protein